MCTNTFRNPGGARLASARCRESGKRPSDLVILENNMSEKQVNVKVIDHWRVVRDDKSYIKDDVLVVPENVAQEWQASGYVERVGKS